jgi:hypothetical protein
MKRALIRIIATIGLRPFVDRILRRAAKSIKTDRIRRANVKSEEFQTYAELKAANMASFRAHLRTEWSLRALWMDLPPCIAANRAGMRLLPAFEIGAGNLSKTD